MFYVLKKHKKQTSDFHSGVFLYAQKKHKMHKKHKNVKQVTFFFLDIFFANKKHENTNKWISDFLPLRRFLSAFKNVFFVFARSYAFLCFQCLWNLFEKKAWNYPNNVIYIITRALILESILDPLELIFCFILTKAKHLFISLFTKVKSDLMR